MKYVSVEVDVREIIEDMDFDDLCEELNSRLRKLTKNAKDRLRTKRELDDLKKQIQEISDSLFLQEIRLPFQSLNDKIKIEHLQKVWDNYTPSDFEKLLPE